MSTVTTLFKPFINPVGERERERERERDL